jgi:hypothetical protein
MAQALLNTQKQAVQQGASTSIRAYRIPYGSKFSAVLEFYQKALPANGWQLLWSSFQPGSENATWVRQNREVYTIAYLNNPMDKATYIITNFCRSGCVPSSEDQAQKVEEQGLVRPNAPGKLKLDILVSDNLSFIKQWMSNDTKYGPRINPVRETVPNKMLHCVFLFSGYSASSTGQFDVVVHWKLIKPDGSVMFEQKDFAGAHGKVRPVSLFVMADNSLDLMLEENDPPGQYILEATAEDRVTGDNATASYPIKLHSSQAAPAPWNGKGQL